MLLRLLHPLVVILSVRAIATCTK